MPVKYDNNRNDKMKNSNIRLQNKAILLIIVSLAFIVMPAHANEWMDGYDTPPGFSEFAPPSTYNKNNNSREKFQWRSGSSFKDNVEFKYLPPVKTRNPWKAPKSKYSNKSFSSYRPWGKVPEKRPERITSMRFHDERFKRWSHQVDSSYHNNFSFINVNSMYDRSSLPFITNYGFPGSVYNSPLIRPGLYPMSRLNPYVYSVYPGGLYPYSTVPVNVWSW